MAVDCTFGGGGHARLVADRVGSTGTLIAIDRDPTAEERFAELAREVSCKTRFIRASFVEGLELLVEQGIRADGVYFDLGMSSMQVDTWERGFSYSYDAPLDMRMDPTQELTAREIVNTWDERRLARLLRGFGEERYSGPIARRIVAQRQRCADQHDARAGRDHQGRRPRASPIRRRPSREAKLPGAADRGQRRARASWTRRCRWLGGCSPPTVGSRGISFHSLEDARVKRFLVARARGCICPPGLPVCGCGRVPEGELLSRRSVAPTPGEVAANPRASSARLRVARKLEDQP